MSLLLITGNVSGVGCWDVIKASALGFFGYFFFWRTTSEASSFKDKWWGCCLRDDFSPKGRNENNFRNHEKPYCSWKNIHFTQEVILFTVFNMQKLCDHKMKNVFSVSYDKIIMVLIFAFYIVINTYKLLVILKIALLLCNPAFKKYLNSVLISL